MSEPDLRVLYVEPFHGGSHRRFGELLQASVPGRWTSLTLPGHHWKWRMRGAAVHFGLTHAEALARPHDLVLAGSFLDLAALVALAPAIAGLPKVLYFHENQLAYPNRRTDPRDHHFGYTQIVSALVADRCVFNSAFNRDSFLTGAEDLLRRLPRPRPSGWVNRIADRAEVLGVPVDLGPLEPPTPDPPPGRERAHGPLLLWNHRWEHDKAPDRFFSVLDRLAARGARFRVAIAGERGPEAPACFERARVRLGARVVSFGPLPRPAYLALLRRAQIAISTAEQEFFGLAMIEASHAGALALVPDRLAYPELFPPDQRYASDDALVDRLDAACRAWTSGTMELRGDRRGLTEHLGAPLLTEWGAALRAWARID